MSTFVFALNVTFFVPNFDYSLTCNFHDGGHKSAWLSLVTLDNLNQLLLQ